MHPDIHVRPVDAHNRDDVLALRVHPSQLAWVGRITDLLADAEVCRGCEPMAIAHGDTIIGYYRIELCAATVTGRDSPYPDLQNGLGLRAFFLHHAYQGKGLGGRALRALCSDLAHRHGNRDHLVLTVDAHNHAAIHCYLRGGFEDIGTLYHGGNAGPQLLMRRRLAPLQRPS